MVLEIAPNQTLAHEELPEVEPGNGYHPEAITLSIGSLTMNDRQRMGYYNQPLPEIHPKDQRWQRSDRPVSMSQRNEIDEQGPRELENLARGEDPELRFLAATALKEGYYRMWALHSKTTIYIPYSSPR
jgi:hypothetical protein